MKIRKNKNLMRILIVPVMIGIVLGFRFSFAQTPGEINVTAYIVNSENKEITNGEYDIRFALYGTDRTTIDQYPSTSDPRIWEEVQKVKITDGYINAYLGAVNPVPASVSFSKNNYYLGIRIGTDSEMVPRKRIGAVPLAVDSMSVQGAVPGTSAGNLVQLGTGGKIDISSLPTGTSGKKLVLANDSRLAGGKITISGGYDYITASKLKLTLNQIDLSSDVSGTLDVDLGGTGISSYTTGDILYASGSGTLTRLGIGGAGEVLTVTGGLPAWESPGAGGLVDGSGTAGYVTIWQDANTLTSEQYLDETRGGTGLGSYAAGDMVYATGANTLARLGISSDGRYLRIVAGVPTWVDSPGATSHNLISTAHSDTNVADVPANGDLLYRTGGQWRRFAIGDPNEFLQVNDAGNGIEWNPTTDITQVGTITAGTWNGGVIADAYVNDALTITGGTITGSSISTSNITLVQSASPTPTAEGRVEWDSDNDQFVVGNGVGQTIIGTSVITMSGAYDYITLSGQDIVRGQVNLTTDVTGTLPVANGGTGAITFTSNGVLYGNTTGAIQATAAGTEAQVLVANAAGVPTFVTMGGDVAITAGGTTTIANNAVALTTDTTGNYVASITNGNGITGGNGGSEGAALTLALTSLTSAWNQTGAFDIVLGNAASELQIMESNGATFYGTFDVGDLSADATYTFSGTSGTVLTSANYASTLDSTYVNINESPAAGDITGSFQAGLTVTDDSHSHTAATLPGTVSYLGSSIDLASEVTGTLPVANGGTGAITFTSNGVLYGNTTGAIQATAAGTSGQLLIASDTGVPTFRSMSGDVAISYLGVTTIQADAIGSSEISDNTITEVDLNATNGPTNDYVLSYDETSGGFTWVINDGGTGSSKWTDDGTFTYLTATSDDLVVGGSAMDTGAFVFDVGTDTLTFEGTTANEFETAFSVVDPTADRTINLPNASGTITLRNTTPTSGYAAYWSDANTLASEQYLSVSRGGTGVGTFGGTNTILYTTAADTISSITTGNSGVLVTNGSGVPSIAVDIPTAVTIGSSYIYRAGGTDVALADGGTGASLSDPNADRIMFWDDSAGAVTWLTAASGNFAFSTTTLDLDSTVQLGADGADGTLTLYSEQGVTDYSVVFQPNAAMTMTTTYTLPANDGDPNQVLVTSGGGVLSWQDVSAVSTGDITDVGSFTTGAAFNSISADDQWLGLGAGAGRIEFDDQATDEVNILGARLGVGTSSPTMDLEVYVSDYIRLGFNGSLYLDRALDSAASTAPIIFQRARGSFTSKSAIQSGDYLGEIRAQGWDGDSNAVGAKVYFIADGAVSDENVPGRISFQTWNGANLADRMVIKNSGNVGIGATSPGQLLTVDGTFGILEGGSTPTYHTIFQGGDQSGNITYTLPVDDGSAGYVLTSNGSGVLSWSAAGGSGVTGSGTSGYVAVWDGSSSIAAEQYLSLGKGGTGTSLSDPNADRIMFWDDSAGAVTWLTPASGNFAFSATTLDLDSTVQLGADGADGTLTLYSEQGGTDYSVVFQPNAAMTMATTYTLPANDGDASQVLITDGSGALSWSSVSGVGGVSGTGTSGQVAYWNGTSSIAGEDNLSVTRGGTGVGTLTQDGVLLGNGTNDISAITGTQGQIIIASNLNVPTFRSISGDISLTYLGEVNIAADSVALTTDTTGNYVASITNGNGITGGNGGSEGATLTLALTSLTSAWNQTGAFDIVLGNAASELQIMESNGATFYGTFDVGDLSADATYTFSGTSGTVITSANYASTLDSIYVNISESPAAGDITGSFQAGLTVTDDSHSHTAATLPGTVSYLGSSIDLASEVTGTLPVANGGTGAITFTSNGVLYGNTTGAIQATAAGTSGQLLIASDTGVPTFRSMSGDVAISYLGVTTIQADAIGSSEISDNTITEVDLNVTNGPTNDYVLSYDETSGGFTWVINDGGTGSSKWTDDGTFTYLTATSDDLVVGGSTTDTAGFFFDVSDSSIYFEGSTANAYETQFVITDPTADRTITFQNASGTVAFTSDIHNAVTLAGSYDYLTLSTQQITLGQIDLATDVTGILPVANGGTGITTAGLTGVPYITAGTWSVDTNALAITHGGTGVTSAGDLENLVEGYIFDADAETISGAWTVADNVNLIFGTSGDIQVTYDETTDDRLEFYDSGGSNVMAALSDAGSVGNLYVSGGISTYDSTVSAGYGEFTGLCLGNGTSCITSWGSAGAIDGSGDTGYVAYWTDSNTLSGEATLATNRGGTNQDSSAWSGLVTTSSGTWSSTGVASQGDIIYYNGTSWTELAAGTSGYYLQTQGAGANPIWTEVTSGITDHGGLTGLTDDDHTIYTLLAGRAGGQTLVGGTGVMDDLILRTTSGVGESGADMIFQTGNNGATEAMRILYDGKVGIGDSSPSYALDVNGDAQIQGGELYLTGIASSASTTEGTMYYDTDDDNLYVYANGGWVDLTQQDSNTTYTAGNYIDLSGGGSTQIDFDPTELGTTTWFDGTAGTDIVWTFNGESNDGTFGFYEDEDAFAISGNSFGIGTTAPVDPLAVVLDQNNTSRISLTNSNDGALSAVSFKLYSDVAHGTFSAMSSNYTLAHMAGRVSVFAYDNAGGLDLFSSAASGDMRFYTGGYNTTNERMRVLSTGYVGIGDTTPSALFTVGNGDLFTVNSSGQIQTGNAGQDGSITIYSEQGVTDYTTIFQPGTQTQNITYTLPVDDGTSGQFLTSDGSGVLSWSTAAAHNAVTLAGSYDYLTLSTQQITLGQIDLATDVTGTLPVANGGTGTSTQFTQGSLVFAGASGVYSQDNSNLFWDDSNNRLGIGTAVPTSQLEVYNSAANPIFTITGAHNTDYDPMIQFRTDASPTVKFSLGVDAGDSDKFKIYSGDGIGGTSEFTIDTDGTTSIANLQLGSQVFEENSGAISWVDMSVTSAAADNTIESYTAQLDGNAMLTIYGLSDGAGGVDNLGVGVNTTTPDRRFEILDATNPQLRLTYTDSTVYTDMQTTSSGYLYINPSGSYVGIGDSTPSYALDVNGDAQIQGGELYLTGIASSASTTEGTMYYDTDDDNLYVYANGGWVDLTQQDSNTTYTAGNYIDLSGGGSTQIDFDPTELGTTTWFDGTAGTDIVWTFNGESNDGTFGFYEDEDAFAISGNSFGIGTTAPARTLEVYGGDSAVGYARITGGEDNPAILELYADQGDDNADKWDINSATSNSLFFRNNTTNMLGISSTGTLSIYASDGDYISLSHDGTDGSITSSAGNLNLGTSGDLTLGSGVNIVSEGNFDIKGDATSRTITIGDTGKANDDVVMVDASNWSVQSSGMLNASVDGLGTKVVANSVDDTDFTGTVFNGLMGIDSSTGNLYYRYGGAWHYTAQTGGFQIPNYEVAPVDQLSEQGIADLKNALPYELSSHPEYLTQRLESGEFLIPYVDEYLNNGAAHGLYARFTDVKDIMFKDVNDQIETSQLAISGLEGELNDQNISVDEKLQAVGSNFSSLSAQVTSLNGQLAGITSDQASTNSLVVTIQSQIEEIKEMNLSILSFLTVTDGNVDLLKGKLTAEGVVAGAFTIKVVNEEAKTIGKYVICPAMTDVDDEGKCTVKQEDDGSGKDKTTGEALRDGKSVVIKTKVVKRNSKIFVTPKSAISQPLAVTDINNEEDFTVEVKEPIVEIEGIEFDWFVVGEEKQVKEETSASASSTVQAESTGTTILLNADSSVQ